MTTADAPAPGGSDEDLHQWRHQVVWWDRTFVAIVVLTALALPLANVTGRPLWSSWAAMAAVLLAYAVWGAPAARSRDQRRATAYVVVLITGTTVAVAQAGVATLLLFAAFSQLWMLLEPPRRAVVASVVLALGTTFGIAVLNGFGVATFLQALPQMAVALAFAVMLGLWTATTMRRSDERAQLLDELRDAQAKLAESHHAAGVTAERERLAQEIHDTLAQGFASVITQAQAAGTALDRQDADRARERLRLVEDTARDNLAEARALVAAFVPVPLQGSTIAEALGRLADRFTAETGARVRVEIADGDARHHVRTVADAAVDVVLLRTAQEALSNVRRHADAHDVVLRLDTDGDDTDGGDGEAGVVRLEVTDDGRGVAGSPEGIGLSGMRERVAAAGGTLAVGPGSGGGTRVQVRLPAGGRP